MPNFRERPHVRPEALTQVLPDWDKPRTRPGQYFNRPRTEKGTARPLRTAIYFSAHSEWVPPPENGPSRFFLVRHALTLFFFQVKLHASWRKPRFHPAGHRPDSRRHPPLPSLPSAVARSGRKNIWQCKVATPARARTGRPRRALQERYGCPAVLRSDNSNQPHAHAYVFPPHPPTRLEPKFYDFRPDRRDFHRRVDPGTSRPARSPVRQA